MPMHRIDGDGHVLNRFDPGDEILEIEGTQVTADWLNDVQENIVAVIESAGVVLTKGRAADLLDSINILIANALVSGAGSDYATVALLRRSSGIDLPVLKVADTGLGGNMYFFRDPNDSTTADDWSVSAGAGLTVVSSESTTPVVVGPDPTGFAFAGAIIARPSGSWITDGFQVGHDVTIANAEDPGNDGTWEVDAVTALNLTLSGPSFVTNAADTTATVTLAKPDGTRWKAFINGWIPYSDGTPIDNLKPAEAGADVTGTNTAADVINVNGTPAADIDAGASAGQALQDALDAALVVQSIGDFVADSQISAEGRSLAAANINDWSGTYTPAADEHYFSVRIDKGAGDIIIRHEGGASHVGTASVTMELEAFGFTVTGVTNSAGADGAEDLPADAGGNLDFTQELDQYGPNGVTWKETGVNTFVDEFTINTSGTLDNTHAIRLRLRVLGSTSGTADTTVVLGDTVLAKNLTFPFSILISPDDTTDKDVLLMINAPAEAGADVTGNNTSNDTNNVGGTPSGDIVDGVANALTTVNSGFEQDDPADGTIVPYGWFYEGQFATRRTQVYADPYTGTTIASQKSYGAAAEVQNGGNVGWWKIGKRFVLADDTGTLTVSCWIKPLSMNVPASVTNTPGTDAWFGEDDAHFEFVFFKGDGTQIATTGYQQYSDPAGQYYYDNTGQNTDVSGQWIELTHTTTVPTDAKIVDVRIVATDGSSSVQNLGYEAGDAAVKVDDFTYTYPPGITDITGENYAADLGATAGATWSVDITGQPSDADLLNAQQLWSDISGSGKPADNATNFKTFYQSSAPTNPGDDINAGDIWFDSGSDNQPFRWNGSSWIAIRDQGVTQALNDAASALAATEGSTITTYFQASKPNGNADGDLWFDTDDGNKLYRYDLTSAQELTGDSRYFTSSLGSWVDASAGTASVTHDNAEDQMELNGNVGLDTAEARYTLSVSPSTTVGPAASLDFTGDTITRPSGSWITDGFVKNMSVTVASAEDGGNNGSYLIESVSATALVLVGASFTTNADDETATVVANQIFEVRYTKSDTNSVTFDVGTTAGASDLLNSSSTTGDTQRFTATGSTVYLTFQHSGNYVVEIDEVNVREVGVWEPADDDRIAQVVSDAATAQATADSKIVTYFQSSAPGSPATGDLWYDTDTFILARWDGATWETVSNAYDSTSQLTDDAGLGTTAVWASITGLGKPADYATKVTTYFQPTAPTNGSPPDDLNDGDIWVDSDDDNQLYYWYDPWVAVGPNASFNFSGDTLTRSAGSWLDDGYANGDQFTVATAEDVGNDGTYTITNVTATVITSTGAAFTANADDDTAVVDGVPLWVSIRDAQVTQALADAAAAQSTADGKSVSYYQDAEPGSPDYGDLWIDTNDGNKIYFYESFGPLGTGLNFGTTTISRDTGSWLAEGYTVGNTVTISSAEDAGNNTTETITDVTALTITCSGASFTTNGDDTTAVLMSFVNAQDSDIATAISDASTAQATADGKVTTFYQTSAPTAEGVGDLWYNTNDQLLKRWSGSAWILVSNSYDNTNQLIDGAGLGDTAIWTSITGAGKPEDGATNTKTFSQASAPANPGDDLHTGDFWIDSDDGNKLYRWNGASWDLVRDEGAQAGADLSDALTAAGLGQTIADFVEDSNLSGEGTNYYGQNVNDWETIYGGGGYRGVFLQIYVVRSTKKVHVEFHGRNSHTGIGQVAFELEVYNNTVASFDTDTWDVSLTDQLGPVDFATDTDSYGTNGVVVTTPEVQSGAVDDKFNFTLTNTPDSATNFRIRITTLETDDGSGNAFFTLGDTPVIANPTVPFSGIFSVIDSADYDVLLMTNGPAEAGADVTGNNTAQNTLNVGGSTATEIETGAQAGNDLSQALIDAGLGQSVADIVDLTNSSSEYLPLAVVNVNDWEGTYTTTDQAVLMTLTANKGTNQITVAYTGVNSHAGTWTMDMEVEVFGASITGYTQGDAETAITDNVTAIDFSTANVYGPNGFRWAETGLNTESDTQTFTLSETPSQDVVIRIRIVALSTTDGSATTILSFGDTGIIKNVGPPIQFFTSFSDGTEYDVLIMENAPAAAGADVTGPTIGVKIDYQDWNTANPGEMYIHGFDATGQPADVAGKIFFDTVEYSLDTTGSRVVHTNQTGGGYILFDRDKDDRFAMNGAVANKSTVFVRKVAGQWQYDDNSVWQNFTPEASDLIIGTAFITVSDDIDQATIWGYPQLPNAIPDVTADTTSENTSADTAAVNGTAAADIDSGATAGNTLDTAATNTGQTIDDVVTNAQEGAANLSFATVDIQSWYANPYSPSGNNSMFRIRIDRQNQEMEIKLAGFNSHTGTASIDIEVEAIGITFTGYTNSTAETALTNNMGNIDFTTANLWGPNGFRWTESALALDDDTFTMDLSAVPDQTTQFRIRLRSFSDDTESIEFAIADSFVALDPPTPLQVTVNVNDTSDIDVLNTTNAPAEAGANVTETRTSNDTSNVAGTPSTDVSQGSGDQFGHDFETGEIGLWAAGSYSVTAELTEVYAGSQAGLIETGGADPVGATLPTIDIPDSIGAHLLDERVKLSFLLHWHPTPANRGSGDVVVRLKDNSTTYATITVTPTDIWTKHSVTATIGTSVDTKLFVEVDPDDAAVNLTDTGVVIDRIAVETIVKDSDIDGTQVTNVNSLLSSVENSLNDVAVERTIFTGGADDNSWVTVSTVTHAATGSDIVKLSTLNTLAVDAISDRSGYLNTVADGNSTGWTLGTTWSQSNGVVTRTESLSGSGPGTAAHSFSVTNGGYYYLHLHQEKASSGSSGGITAALSGCALVSGNWTSDISQGNLSTLSATVNDTYDYDVYYLVRATTSTITWTMTPIANIDGDFPYNGRIEFITCWSSAPGMTGGVLAPVGAGPGGPEITYRLRREESVEVTGDLTFSASTITRASGSWVDDGYYAAQSITITDAEDPANNGTYTVSGTPTATVLTVVGSPFTVNADDDTAYVRSTNGTVLYTSEPFAVTAVGTVPAIVYNHVDLTPDAGSNTWSLQLKWDKPTYNAGTVTTYDLNQDEASYIQGSGTNWSANIGPGWEVDSGITANGQVAAVLGDTLILWSTEGAGTVGAPGSAVTFKNNNATMELRVLRSLMEAQEYRN